jgi:probable HAF family extracellular repeat protein
LFDGTSYSTLNYGTSYTDGFDINNAGQIVGDYFDGSYIPHAFLFNGTSYGDIIYPGARSTYVRGINNMGQAVGFYEDSSGKSHMFLATPLPVSNP